MRRPAETPPGPALWSFHSAGVEARFTGRGGDPDRRRTLVAAGGEGLELAWARQVHSARLLDARDGDCGRGDGLVTTGNGLALAIATADCVPLLLASPRRVAAVHAGWRGIAAGIVLRAAERLTAGGEAVHAWIGPSIGPCCYEVGAEVAGPVIEASDRRVAKIGARGKPHLDLQLAVTAQLESLGVEIRGRVGDCTRCNPDRLWSYRRSGAAAGRNFAFIWRTVNRPAGA